MESDVSVIFPDKQPRVFVIFADEITGEYSDLIAVVIGTQEEAEQVVLDLQRQTLLDQGWEDYVSWDPLSVCIDLGLVARDWADLPYEIMFGLAEKALERAWETLADKTATPDFVRKAFNVSPWFEYRIVSVCDSESLIVAGSGWEAVNGKD